MAALEVFSENKSYDFFADIGNLPIESKESKILFHDIIATTSFQRLKNISFLGGADYITKINGKFIKHNRYHHSIGVGVIADYSMKYLNNYKDHYNTIIFFALMHDIGHFPLSHTLEPVIRKLHNIDHHSMGFDIIFKEEKGFSEIRDIIRKYKINEQLLGDILNGNLEIPLVSSKKINIDTIDAIPRSYQYFNNSKAVMNPYHLVDCFFTDDDQKSRRVLADFWISKGNIYRNLLQSIDILSSEILAREIFLNHSERFEMSQLRFSDKQFLSVYPEIKVLFNKIKSKKLVFNQTKLFLNSELDIANFIDRKFVINDWSSHSDLSDAFEEIRQDAFIKIEISVSNKIREKKLL